MHPRRFLRRRRNLWISSQSKKTKRKDRKRKKNERTAIALGSDDDEVFLGASGQFQFALVAVRDAVGAADFVAGQLRQHCGVVFVLFCFVLFFQVDSSHRRSIGTGQTRLTWEQPRGQTHWASPASSGSQVA